MATWLNGSPLPKGVNMPAPAPFVAAMIGSGLGRNRANMAVGGAANAGAVAMLSNT